MAAVTADDFLAHRVTNPGQSEIYRNRLYDFQLYPAAGTAQLSFFNAAIGQGVTSALGAVVGSQKTQADTNMETPGTLPSGKSYLIETVEVLFFPGSVNTANTYTPAVVGSFAAVANAAVFGPSNDVNTLYQSGVLELNVLSKNYLRETPLEVFPPKAWLDNSSSALASNAAATGVSSMQIARAGGRPYYIEPNITLMPAVNFEVILKWPSPVPLPSGFNGRIGVALDGLFMRASQ